MSYDIIFYNVKILFKDIETVELNTLITLSAVLTKCVLELLPVLKS